MNIVIYSSRFFPQVGGMETVIVQLATSFAHVGNSVTVITPVPLYENQEEKIYPFRVMRNPSFVHRFYLAKKASVILHNSISLKALFPDFLFCTKFFVTHQTWFGATSLGGRLSSLIKLRLCKWVHNIYVSQAIRDHIGEKGIIIANPY